MFNHNIFRSFIFLIIIRFIILRMFFHPFLPDIAQFTDIKIYRATFATLITIFLILLLGYWEITDVSTVITYIVWFKPPALYTLLPSNFLKDTLHLITQSLNRGNAIMIPTSLYIEYPFKNLPKLLRMPSKL